MIIKDAVDYKGCSHIHSTYSDGSGAIAEIVAAAAAVELDFLILTDHNSVEAKYDGWEGWRSGVLVMVGAEVSPKGMGHCVAIGIDRCRNYRAVPPEEYLADLREQGGVCFVAHPLGGSNPVFRVRLTPWKHWRLGKFAGMEIWSYMHDWISDLKLWTFPHHYLRPQDKITGPAPELLAIWDELTQTRKVVGISGLDVHARKSRPLAIVNVFPYEMTFRTLRTHIISPPFTGGGDHDLRLLVDAHREGRCYVAHDRLGDASGFRFEGESGDDGCHMGAALSLDRTARLFVRAPRRCRLRLLRYGHEVAAATHEALEHCTDEPGAYRVEARLKKQPWVFTNPIYLV